MYRQIYDNATSLFTEVGLFIKENGGKHKVTCLQAIVKESLAGDNK
jgi:hypothetical protein